MNYFFNFYNLYDKITNMSKYFKIVKDNEKSLREKCQIVENINDDVVLLLNKMKDYLAASQDEKIREKYHIREGVGLAAPQIGKNIRALVVYYQDVDNDGNTITIDHRLINPKIVSESVREVYLSNGEGCLSVDEDHKGYVYRKYKIIVKAINAETRKEEFITARGFEAIVLQHEIDHLDGILYYDRIDKKDPFLVKPDAIRL